MVGGSFPSRKAYGHLKGEAAYPGMRVSLLKPILFCLWELFSCVGKFLKGNNKSQP